MGNRKTAGHRGYVPGLSTAPPCIDYAAGPIPLESQAGLCKDGTVLIGDSLTAVGFDCLKSDR